MKKLIIKNLSEFFEQEFDTPFKMLFELEEILNENEDIKIAVLISYSEKYSGDAIFLFVKKDSSNYIYEFQTTIS